MEQKKVGCPKGRYLGENNKRWKGGRKAIQERSKLKRRVSRECQECGNSFYRIKGAHLSFRWCERCIVVKYECLNCKKPCSISRKEFSEGRGKFCSLQCTWEGITPLVPRGKKCHLYKDGRSLPENRKQYSKNHRLNNPERYSQYTINRMIKRKGNGGEHTLEEWENLKAKFQHICLCCKQQEPFIKLTRDHVIPISMGGSNDITNIQPLCLSCNVRKHTKEIDYRTLFVNII